MRRSILEVTAQNEGALRMYQRLGFRRRKTLYKAVNMSQSEYAHKPGPAAVAEGW